MSERRYKVRIAEQHFHNAAHVLVEAYSKHCDTIRRALNREITLEESTRQDLGVKRPGVTAKSFNVAIRDSLGAEDALGMRFECLARDGFFVSDGNTQGFDFAYIDEELNTVTFRNRCIGSLAFAGGIELWREAALGGYGIRQLEPSHPVYHTAPGVDCPESRTAPCLLGEVQLGNWALLYYDFFKALAAQDSAVLDLYIYICPTGRLQELLSKGIVNYSDVRSELTERRGVLRFPIWLIGVDVDEAVKP